MEKNQIVNQVSSQLEKFENENKLAAREDFWVALRSYPLLRVKSKDEAIALYNQLLDSIKSGDLHCDESELSVWCISCNPYIFNS